mgnify:FL=1
MDFLEVGVPEDGARLLDEGDGIMEGSISSRGG